MVALIAPSAFAQSPALLEAVRGHAPGLAQLARDELDACVATTPPCPRKSQLSLLTGVLMLSEGDARGAAELLAKTTPTKRLEPFHGWYLGEAQSWADARPQALKTLLKAKVNAPATLSKRIEARVAELQLELGQAAKARGVLERLASENATAETLRNRALARLLTGARAEARTDLRTMLLRFPTHPHAAEAMRRLSVEGTPVFSFEEQLQRAQALIGHGAPTEALHQLDAVTLPTGAERESVEARVALVRASALFAKGDEAGANAQLEFTIAKGRPNAVAEAMMTKARRLMRSQDHQGARALMLAVDTKYPNAGSAEDAAYLGAWVSLADGDYQRAVDDFDSFEKRHAESKKRDEARWYRAWALARLGKHAEARNGLQAIAEDFPKSSLVPQVRYWSTRFAQLGALREVRSTRELTDGGVLDVRLATPDAGQPIDIVREYRELASAHPGSLYALLAAERLRATRSAPRPFGMSPRSLSTRPTPTLALATELAEAGLLRDASEELSRVAGTVGSSDEALNLGHALQQLDEYGTAHGLAARWLWGQVYTAQRPEALALMYPRAYQNSVERSATDVGLDPFLAWAIMRRESGFRPEVVSTADARGLMQIIPPTARAIAKELNAPTPDPDELYAPAMNVRFGTWYLSALLKRLAHPALCAAAYNAGPNAVVKWLHQKPTLPLDEFIEEIPYKETRGYVKQVLADYFIYHALYGTPEARPSLSMSLPPPQDAGVTF